MTRMRTSPFYDAPSDLRGSNHPLGRNSRGRSPLQEAVPWDNVPGRWKDALSSEIPITKFDNDNVIQVWEMINPSACSCNAAVGLLPTLPDLLTLQAPCVCICNTQGSMPSFCMTTQVHRKEGTSITAFDTDSEVAGIDNRSSVCLSPAIHQMRHNKEYPDTGLRLVTHSQNSHSSVPHD